MNVFHLAPGATQLRRLIGGERILDMRAGGYGPEEARRLFGLLGAEGRGLYLRLLWTLDLGLPAMLVRVASAVTVLKFGLYLGAAGLALAGALRARRTSGERPRMEPT